ncbi:MAG: recombination mediator RecR [Bacteroidota bacterium]
MIQVENYSSHLLETTVQLFSRLPGIGKKSALRLALHLLKQDKQEAQMLGESIIKMRNEVMYCQSCHNISDSEFCGICSNPSRNESIICVVSDIRDVLAIENTSQFNGHFHILGGVISPMDGISPGELNIQTLVDKISKGKVNEVILALPTTIEGDTTNFYIYKQLKSFAVSISVIARGIAFGDELEYTDEITLGRSIINRTPYENSFAK